MHQPANIRADFDFRMGLIAERDLARLTRRVAAITWRAEITKAGGAPPAT